jgi:Flp pilus assembly protein TadD
LDDAIIHYRQAIQINPNHWDAHISLGTALAQEGDVDNAVIQYQTALQIYPDAEVAHVNLGIVLLQKGRTGAAMAHFQKGLQLEPDDVKALKYLAWLQATSPAAALRDGAGAVELARHANTLTGGENPDILHILAAALAEAGQFSEALKTANRALLLATAQPNPRMAGQLQYEISLYQAGRRFHTPE